MLEVKNLTKIYEGFNGCKALDNVSIDFGSRGLVVVLGKSGCGKSTLLNVIGGLDTATHGEVVINGRSTTTFKRSDFDAYRNTYVGIVFQEFNLIDEISVYDNINMTMKLQEKNADVNTVDEVLEKVGLANLGYRKPSELSGGQRQRVALARALLKKPEILLADEPTGALDSATGEGVFETLKRIAAEKLVIVVTHNRELAYGYADRIIELADGKVIGDTSKAVETDKSVRELEGGIIEISAGGKVTKEQINKRLADGKINYIGLSHEKDRIALAYPETVEGFYSAADKAAFEPTDKEKIPKDNKPFVLSKGGLKVKDSVKIARAGMKRSKHRYRFLVFVTSVCFTFFSLALMVGLVSTPAIVAKSSFESGSQPLVAVALPRENGYYGTKKLEREDVNKLSEFLDSPVAAAVKTTVSPIWADGNVKNDYTNVFDMSTFDAVLETADAAGLGLDITSGTGKCNNAYEIVISDFAAYALCKHGYIGYGKDGKYSVLNPVAEQDIVGTSLIMKETQKSYKIVGVYSTDYNKYRAAMSSWYQTDAEKLRDTFASNKAFMYCKLISCSGFVSEYVGKSIVGNDDYDFLLEITDANGYIMGYRTDRVSLKYDKFAFKEQVLWSAHTDSDGEFAAPDSLADNEMIVDFRAICNAMDLYDIPWEEPEKILSLPEFGFAIGRTYQVEVNDDDYSQVATLSGMKIAGVTTTDGNYYGGVRLMLSGSVVDSLAGGERYDLMYVGRGFNEAGLKSMLSKLDKSGYLYGSAVADYNSVTYFGELLKGMGTGFLVAAFVLLALAFLTIFNYMSASIRFRTKEIAVYRVIGAKTSDIFKMFLAEGGFIVAITSVIAIVLSFLISLLVNEALSGALSVLGMGFTVVNFGWIVNPLAIIAGSALIVLLSSLAPILRITRKRPVEAVKLI